MRFSSAATVLWFGLLPVAAGFAADPPAPRPGEPAAATTPAAAAGPATGTSAASASNDAAAKHAKRTACLKDAKAKKLIGADKTSFIHACIAAP